ncbi:hypothetical protein SCG7086_AI_00070 [Chlamydiales bacterium SCGC AG-110-P3]|nr:hypothetical protein SCG7086_AI_00070 [Chlamydiales bacterium SCGC AG-110-P3]
MTSEPNSNEQDIPVLLSIRDFANKHPFMSENSIRWLLYKDQPGLEDCLVRVSRRIYLKEKSFFDFLTSLNARNGNEFRENGGNNL